MKHLLEFNIFDLLIAEEEKQLVIQRQKTKAKIDTLKNKIEYLKTTGDDLYVKQEISEYRRQIAKLQDSLLSDEQRAKKTKQVAKAVERRHKKETDQYKIQNKIEKKFQAQLTEREKAINQLADLQYGLKNSRKYPSNYSKKIQKQFDDLKTKYNVKSYEIKKKKLLKLETNILLSIDTLEAAVDTYRKLLLVLNNKKTTQQDKREAHKMLHDLEKFYTYQPFSNIMDNLFPN